MYKNAIRNKMRVLTPKGELSIEKLFDLSMADLKTTLISLDEAIRKQSGSSLDFLETTVNPELQSKFDLVKDIYLTKQDEIKETRNAASKKAENQTILALIHEKEQEALRGKTVEELKAMLK